MKRITFFTLFFGALLLCVGYWTWPFETAVFRIAVPDQIGI